MSNNNDDQKTQAIPDLHELLKSDRNQAPPDDEEAASTFQSFLDSPDRVVIEFRPDYKLGFDSKILWQRSPVAGRKAGRTLDDLAAPD